VAGPVISFYLASGMATPSVLEDPQASSAQFLNALLQGSDQAIVSKTLEEGTILTFNAAAEKLYGYTAEEAQGKSIEELIPSEGVASEREIRAKVAAGHPVLDIRAERIRKNGTTVTVQMSTFPIKDDAGNVIAAAGFARDIDPHASSAQFLNALLQGSDQAIVSKTLEEGTILTFNAAAEKLYGYTAEEAQGKSIEELIVPPEGIGQEREIRAKVAAGKPVLDVRAERLRGDSTKVSVQISTFPIKDDAGNVIAAAGFARDITAELAAFETEERARAMIESSSDAIVSKTLEEGRILSWNAAATKMYGYTEEEAVGQHIEDLLLPPEAIEQELEIRRKIGADERVSRYEQVRRKKDGTLVTVSLSISPVKDSDGKIIGAAGFARDITKIKRREQLADIVLQSDDAIVVKNLETGLIEDWNDAATRLYGWSREEAIGKSIDILIPPEDRANDKAIRAQILAGKAVSSYRTRRLRKDGSLVDVELSISPIKSEETGTITHAARFARNITEAKRLEQEQANAAGLLARFVDFTSHDFKTPMHIALQQATLARRALDNDDLLTLKECLEGIEQQTSWMCDRTEGLLTAAQLSLKKGRTARQKANVEEAFVSAVSQLRGVDEYAHAATIVHEGLPTTIRSSKTLLEFLFSNLIQNACKYGRPGATVEVRASAKRGPDGWNFAITDNGMGIESEYADEVFEPHVRIPDPASEDSVSGYGIGLHFCRTIVEWHGGSIRYESGPGGVGSTFAFNIPD
jgi:PAS domain S-box-containing protein